MKQCRGPTREPSAEGDVDQGNHGSQTRDLAASRARRIAGAPLGPGAASGQGERSRPGKEGQPAAAPPLPPPRPARASAPRPERPRRPPPPPPASPAPARFARSGAKPFRRRRSLSSTTARADSSVRGRATSRRRSRPPPRAASSRQAERRDSRQNRPARSNERSQMAIGHPACPISFCGKNANPASLLRRSCGVAYQASSTPRRKPPPPLPSAGRASVAFVGLLTPSVAATETCIGGRGVSRHGNMRRARVAVRFAPSRHCRGAAFRPAPTPGRL